MLAFLIGLAATAYLLHELDSTALELERDKKTSVALAAAKAALLSYASAVNLSIPCPSTNCPRPGDLPCPDTNNDGLTESSCGNAAGTTGQTMRLGRLPWKTLGLPDLRDGSGERLWYAVSSPYKYNSRYRPLNSDTVGTITLRDSAGNIVNDGSVTTGLVAVVFSPGAPIVRQDGTTQSRDSANVNNPVNYLDIALGEDNQNFSDGGTNGFIQGEVKDVLGKVIVNDSILAVSRDEIIQVMEARVLAEATNAMLDYYCGIGNVNYSTKSCVGTGGNFPYPADFIDINCLGNAGITGLNCPEGPFTHGRIPANPATAWSATSIFRGISTGNWFQLNAWREIIHYAVAPACVTGTLNCGGGGLLTLNNPVILPANNKFIILTAAGKTLGGQLRASNVDKMSEANYLEGENYSPLDDVYERILPLTASFNDRATSLQ